MMVITPKHVGAITWIKRQLDVLCFKILKILVTLFRSTCFGHPFVHHQELLSCTCSLWPLSIIRIHVVYCCFHGVFTLFVVLLYSYIDIIRFYVPISAWFIVPDGCFCPVQFSFGVLVFVDFTCLFGIDKIQVHQQLRSSWWWTQWCPKHVERNSVNKF